MLTKHCPVLRPEPRGLWRLPQAAQLPPPQTQLRVSCVATGSLKESTAQREWSMVGGGAVAPRGCVSGRHLGVCGPGCPAAGWLGGGCPRSPGPVVSLGKSLSC